MSESTIYPTGGAAVAEIERVTRQHLRECPTLGEYCTACECSAVVVIRCGFCHRPMWLVPVSGWCRHAEDLSGEWHRVVCGEVPA